MNVRAGKVAVLALPVAAAAAAAAALLHTGAGPARVPPHRVARAVLHAPWYLGVREPGAPGSWAPISRFARLAGTRPRLVLTYSGLREPFQLTAASTAHRHGAVLLVQLQPWGMNLGQLARGGYDRDLRSLAREVRGFRLPVIIGFGHEMNGPWYPWGLGHVSAPVFVTAWRHLVTVFRAVGADNVTWLWTVHHTAQAALLRSYWPGSRYVTWVGIDGYYEFHNSTFGRVFGRAVRAVRTFTNKPILASETAVGPGAGQVAAKIRGLFAGARRDHFIGLVWFDVAQHAPPFHQDWRLEGRPAALAAFRGAAQQQASLAQRTGGQARDHLGQAARADRRSKHHPGQATGSGRPGRPG